VGAAEAGDHLMLLPPIEPMLAKVAEQ